MTRLWLATGAGRSGTAWTARLFTELGWPCGHEQLYRPGQRGPLTAAESSWLAVPYLADLPDGVPVLRIVCDPWRVVQSVMRGTFLDDPGGGTPYDRFVAEHQPWILEAGDKLGRAIRWAAEWDRPLDQWPHAVLQPDRSDPVQVIDAVWHATGEVPRQDRVVAVMAGLGRVNASRSDRPAPTHHEIAGHREGWRVEARAERWGYGCT